MKKYILNISTAKIHDKLFNCPHLKRAKRCNLKYFDTYDEAENFYEGNKKKAEPCGTCLKAMQ